MFVVGLTGGIGSGKSTVAALFAKKGIEIIDTDLLARELTEPGQPVLQHIKTYFGDAVLNDDQSLNRAALKKIIFNHPEKRKWLENLLHPLIRAEMNKKVLHATSPYCIAVIPLLAETAKNDLINRVLVVDTTESIQRERTETRDQLSQEEVSAILKSQVSREERLAHADDVIDNNLDIAALIPQVKKLHELYLSLSK